MSVLLGPSQEGTESSLIKMADATVSPRNLVTVALKMAGSWEVLAIVLSPELFDTNRLIVIRKNYESNAETQATAMLDQWNKHFATTASCQMLISALCEMGARATAADVFGAPLVELVGVKPRLQDLQSRLPAADATVSQRSRVSVCLKIAGSWEDLARVLSPKLFDSNCLKVIRRKHEANPIIQAKEMLDQWSNYFAASARCRLLITALCEMGRRATAVHIFGARLVEFVQPPNVD